jgi:STE24 endopeptidase
MVFLIIYHFTSKVFTAGWELFTTFDLNERHGFNKQKNLSLFISDFIKTTVLWIVLGGPAFYLVMKVIEWGGDLFFLWLLILSVSFIFIYKYLYINFIGPMFNKYESLNSVKYEKLISDIRCLCNNDSKFPIDKIYVVDQSKRTGHSNAMITGFGNHQSIIIFDNLLIKKKPKKEEVEAKKESLSKDQQK